MSLKEQYEKIENIASYSGRKDKESLIRQYVKDDDLFIKVVFYALHPFKQFNTKQVKFVSVNQHTKEYQSIENIFNMLDYLASRRGATDYDISWLSALSSFDNETVELVWRIVNKDLRCGASVKTFKKFIPELPEHSVMRCEDDISKFLKKCNHNFKNIVWSLKLDGARCTTMGNGIYLSRNGKEFPNFDKFDVEFRKLNKYLEQIEPNINWNNVAKDGEVVIEDETGVDFQDLMTQLRRLENVDPSKFKFYIFDIALENYLLKDRLKILEKAFYLQSLSSNSNDYINDIFLLEHHSCADFENIEQIIDLSDQKVKEGYEGLVLKNLDSYYENKKSKQWCKIKPIITKDVKCIGWLYGTGANKNRIGSLTCQFKDGTTFETSGLTDEQRENFMINTPNIIEIEFNEYTKDGKPRFPRFKRVRGDKDEID